MALNEEIERKFLVSVKRSELEEFAENIAMFKQFYLRTGHEQIRVSCRTNINGDCWEYELGIKIGHGLVRKEQEFSLDKEIGELLCLGRKGLIKTRYYVGRWEIDVFEDDQLGGLTIAEVELKEKYEPTPNFPHEPWPMKIQLVKEVTDFTPFENQFLVEIQNVSEVIEHLNALMMR